MLPARDVRSTSADEVLEALQGTPRARLLLLAAHPDDDVIGAGGLLSGLRSERVVAYVTDGCPRDPSWAERAGFTSAEAYAAARRAEATRALELAGLGADRQEWLGFVDQEPAFRLTELTFAVLQLIRRVQPAVVLTHPYEGGHPDHDASAFAAHNACALLARTAQPRPTLIEFTSYHAQNQRVRIGTFLRGREHPEVVLELAEDKRAIKQAMLDAHVTQRAVIADFGFRCDEERFRRSPTYDFSQAPHDAFLYERFLHSMTGSKWLRLTQEALSSLGLRHPAAS